MMTRERKAIVRGRAAAIALAAVFLAACEEGDTDEDRDDRVAAELPNAVDTGVAARPDTPRQEPLDTATPDTIVVHDPGWSPTDCTAAVKPDRVMIQNEPMLITYTFAADFPEPDSVLADTNSGIAVESIDKKLTLVKLNLTNASEGQWMLRFLGAGNRACDAMLTVRRAS